MRGIWRTPIPLIIAAFIVMGSLYAWDRATAPYSAVDAYSATAPQKSYTNSTYGYSLSYPAALVSQELAPQYTEIGQEQNGVLPSQADIAVLYANSPGSLASFEDFIKLSAGLACNVSGQNPVACTTVASSSSFSTGSGISGTELYFNSNEGIRGPFIGFNISNNVPNEQYAVLLIYPPTALMSGKTDAAFLEQVASSVQITSR